MSNLNPQPKSWPRCSECRTAYVLRRAVVFNRDGRALAINSEWLWQRDCKHRKATAEVGGVRNSKTVRGKRSR